MFLISFCGKMIRPSAMVHFLSLEARVEMSSAVISAKSWSVSRRSRTSNALISAALVWQIVRTHCTGDGAAIVTLMWLCKRYPIYLVRFMFRSVSSFDPFLFVLLVRPVMVCLVMFHPALYLLFKLVKLDSLRYVSSRIIMIRAHGYLAPFRVMLSVSLSVLLFGASVCFVL